VGSVRLPVAVEDRGAQLRCWHGERRQDGRHRAFAGGEKADVDYVFDIPVELVTQLCGYRYDKWKFDWGQPVFTTLRKVTR